MPALQITFKDPAQLRRRDRNPRTHSPKQIRQIAASIKEFGFVSPVLVDGSDGIIAGHGRVEAAKLLGMTAIPTVCVGHLTPAQVRAYVIADNRLAERAGWDRKLLAIELQELSVEPDFDVAITGFEIAGADIAIGEASKEAAEEAQALPRIDWTRRAVSQPGDLWRIGDHYLLCGDPLDRKSYQRLLGGAEAELVFTDPPRNAALSSDVSGRTKSRRGVVAMASGGASESDYTNFLKTAFDRLCAASADGAIHFICSDWRHMREVLEAASKTYTELKDLCIWTKTDAGIGSFYRSQHELVFVFKNGGGPHVNNIKRGRRHRSNVWPYPGLNTFGKDRNAEHGRHATVKPLALIADAIMDCSKRGALVLDAFAGSGTTPGHGARCENEACARAVISCTSCRHCPKCAGARVACRA